MTARHMARIESETRRPNMQNRHASRRLGAWAGVALWGALAISAGSLVLASTAVAQDKPAAAAKITEEQAKAIALKTMPGKVTGVAIEKKKGKTVYVVEIMTEKKGEVDVFVDVVSGKVIGTD
jgi:uncharacterized membrane protein YkoI